MPNKLDQRQMSEETEQETNQTSSWLKKGTRLERILCFITVASLLMVAAMAAALAVFGYLYSNEKGLKYSSPVSTDTDNTLASKNPVSNVCVTPGCVKTAAAILSNIDENVDPCNDFYRFACGKWLDRAIIPDDKSSASIYHDSVDDLNLDLRILLETKLNGDEPLFISMTKEVYDTCMDLETIENAGSEPLQNMLKSLGGWPVVEGKRWNRSKFNWTKALISLRNSGYNYNIILRLSVTVDFRNNALHTIILDQPYFGMPDRTYLLQGLNDSSTRAYYKQMVESAKLFGANEENAKRELLKALEFEMALANYSLPREERRNHSKIYNKYTIEQLQEMVPQIPWLPYLRGLLTNEIYENESLIVAVPDYIKKSAELISETDRRVIANYIFWRVVEQSLPNLSKEWREISLEYNQAITGKSREKPRWKHCLSQLSWNLGIALSSYYVRHYFEDETKQKVLELVKYVHEEFLRILEETDWMDEYTKTHAKAKANNMIFQVGYPDELLNNTAVMEHYQNLTISNSYFENMLKLEKWSTDNSFSKLRKPNIRKNWKKYADVAIVNAFHYRQDNTIDLPAGYLQSPYFNKDRPNYMNFASMGTTIGHEITHGFDDIGRQYDKDGNNVDWWEKATDEHFRKKTQCIIDQFSNYTAENGMNLNGVTTQGENIADLGALKESYWAYQSWVKDNGPEQLLPGLKYSQNQMFWLGAAYEWCAKFRPENLKRMILTYPHSPDEFRVTGPMSNLPEFSRDFNCPPDSPMNKKHKCEVW